MGGREEVFTAGDECDALVGIVDRDGQMIAGGDVFADEDDVAELFGMCDLIAALCVVPMELAGEIGGVWYVETP